MNASVVSHLLLAPSKLEFICSAFHTAVLVVIVPGRRCLNVKLGYERFLVIRGLWRVASATQDGAEVRTNLDRLRRIIGTRSFPALDHAPNMSDRLVNHSLLNRSRPSLECLYGQGEVESWYRGCEKLEVVTVAQNTKAGRKHIYAVGVALPSCVIDRVKVWAGYRNGFGGGFDRYNRLFYQIRRGRGRTEGNDLALALVGAAGQRLFQQNQDGADKCRSDEGCSKVGDLARATPEDEESNPCSNDHKKCRHND